MNDLISIVQQSDELVGNGSILHQALTANFGFKAFRSYQEEVCQAAYDGKDVLLVMPTGAGKSLCYQLPTVAKPDARTIIITPLLALIEDQVAKLMAQGIAVDRIHSGRSRSQSQDACRQWREGELKFLFIAPERLAVPGFLEFLELHKPSTVAVDEAHCISCWGHDFRPEYRMLGPRLARLRPANIIAVTATATPTVQTDIAAQLQLQQPQIFIHGFRRTNIAIDVMSMSLGARIEGCRSLLKDSERRPAIVYAPTRKLTEATAKALAKSFKAAAFHAGLPPLQRQEVQRQFLSGELDVIVATIAFGMGIDKANVRTVVHTALPSSLEGYYQEIGRAGRDGGTSEAVMMYAPIDMKTHEYFFELNYPDVLELQNVFSKIPVTGIDRQSLLESTSYPEVQFNAMLEKLWVHGGIQMDEFGQIRSVDANWPARYNAQRRHKKHQLDGVLKFAVSIKCRMLQFLEHFGDHDDRLGPCKLCDNCLGTHGRDKRHIDAFTVEERDAQKLILAELKGSLARTFGQVFKDLFEQLGWQRRRMEVLVDDLVDRKLILCRSDTFKKDGATHNFKWLELTDAGRVWLHQAGMAPALASQKKQLESKKVAAVRRRNGKKRRS